MNEIDSSSGKVEIMGIRWGRPEQTTVLKEKKKKDPDWGTVWVADGWKTTWGGVEA